ncbi:MAG TPA: isochorismatase family protein [Candidatus Obscuribacterales bacterium]
MVKQLLHGFKLLAGGLRSMCATRNDTVLVVIDMQPRFLPDRGDTSSPEAMRALAGVAREIVRARRRGMPIVLVEYRRYAPTHPYLMKLLTEPHYGRHRVVRKGQMDGSKAVLFACRAMGLGRPRRFRVCGTYTHYCVEETVLGLSRKRPQDVVEVVTSACTDPSGNRWFAFIPACTGANVSLV